MRSIWMTLCVVLIVAGGGVCSFAQTAPAGGTTSTAQSSSLAAAPPLPKEPAAIFAAAAPFYDFSSPALKPWHMKVSYQLYDEKGNATSTGIFERWWAGPENSRITFTRGGTEYSEWRVAGQWLRLQKGLPRNYFERQLQTDWLLKLPGEETQESMQLELKERKIAEVKMECVMFKRTWNKEALCFDPSYPMVRAHIHEDESVLLFNNIVRVQGRFLPKNVSISNDKAVMLRGKLEIIDAITADAPELTPAKTATPFSKSDEGRLTGGEPYREGLPISPRIKGTHSIYGTVILFARVGTDGRPNEMSIVSGPDPTLEAEAIDLIQQSRYQPYLRHGLPVEVERTFKVAFPPPGQ